MTNYTASRVGQVNASGDDLALFLKMFAGEILTTFEEVNVMMDKHIVRTIDSGKSAQFPATGIATAAYHTPGVELTGTSLNHNERVITIDDLLVSHAFIANIDEAMAQYDYRSIYSQELARALSKQMDKHLFQQTILAARGSATVSGGNGGSVIQLADVSGASSFLTEASKLADSLFLAAQKLDEKDVPENDRYAIVKPAQYNLLVKGTDVINKDWGGSGSYAEGEVLKVAGLHIVKSNHLPTANVTTGTVQAGTDDKYRDGTGFANTAALVFQKGAVGTVKLMDLAMESEYQISRQGTLIVAKYAVGHGILRPECAVEIRNA